MGSRVSSLTEVHLSDRGNRMVAEGLLAYMRSASPMGKSGETQRPSRSWWAEIVVTLNMCGSVEISRRDGEP